MMDQEVIDEETGAIIFKKSKEQRMLEDLAKKVKELEERIRELEEKIRDKDEEDS